MKCRIKKIISTASVLALTVAATPGAKLYDEAQAVLGNAASITLTAKADTISEATTWNKATTLTEDTVVDGDLNISADVDLNGFTLTVNGDLTQSDGTIICNNGKLNINGTYYFENAAAANDKKNYYSCYADLILSEESDQLNIKGDLELHGIVNGHGIIYDAGIINVSGNINADSGLRMNTDNHTVLKLNGKNDQYVYFGNCPTLNILNITDSDKREIVWRGDMNVARLDSDINVRPDGLNLGNINLAGYSMAVNGDCGITKDTAIDINSGVLTINGDFTQAAGTIACNNGKLNINGNYYFENAAANAEGKKNYYSCYANLMLSEESDQLNIKGDLELHGIVNGHGIIYDAGIINVSGNINADSGLRMNTDNHTVLKLNGKNDQYVYFGNCPTLNILNITDPDKREIVWRGDMNVARLDSDINVRPDGLNLGYINLASYSMAVNGDCGIAKDTAIDINSGVLTINGDFIQAVGTITCNNGKLNINGTYYFENAAANADGKKNYYSCFANLMLSEESDQLNIKGDLELHGIVNGHGILQNAGTITVSGNINSDSGFRMNADNYTVLKLNGNTKQKIDLAAGTKINILVINKPLSYYEFNQENCWMELVTDYPAVVIKSWEKGNGAVKLNWDAVFGAEKYAIAGYVNGKWKVLDYGTGTSYVLKGLKPGVKYKVAVVAKIDGKWNLDVSKAVIVTPKTVNKYPVVTAEVSGKQFRLKWKPADAAEKYAIAVFQSGKWVVKVQLNSDVTSYTSPKLNNGTYKLVVCAKVNGKWDTSDLNKRAVTVTIK